MRHITSHSSLVNRLATGVQQAGQHIMKAHFSRNGVSERTKVSAYDYGIPADKAAEKIILAAVRDTGLNARIVTEESGLLEKNGAEYTIFIDPLDGSVNFSRGIGAFCLGLAVFRHHQPWFSIVYDPVQKELFVGEMDKGITLNGKVFQPYMYTQNMLVNVEWSGAPQYEEILARLRAYHIRTRTAGSGVLASTYAVFGRGDGVVLTDNWPWDIAPALVMAHSLGYTTTDLIGKPFDLFNQGRDVIIAPPRQHQLIVEAVN